MDVVQQIVSACVWIMPMWVKSCYFNNHEQKYVTFRVALLMLLLCWPGVQSAANGNSIGGLAVSGLQSNGISAAPGSGKAGSQALDADLFGGGLSQPSTTSSVGVPVQVSLHEHASTSHRSGCTQNIS